MSQSSACRWMCAVAALVVCVGCLGGSGKKTIPVFTPAAPLFATVIDGSFVVKPRNFTSFQFTVEDGMLNPRLQGSFSASGANNDIEVIVFEESQFLNWQNRVKFRAAYESGRITADKLQIDLPSAPAKYVMIFSNRFSIFSNKGVIANVKLLYDRVTQ